MWSAVPSSVNYSDEVCLIDSGIKNLKDVPLNQKLKVLNLHCNQIKKIECLEYLQTLQHLDLSSNQICSIQGLEYLFSLRTLNLACNLIDKLQGLQNLRNLVKLNLSYNQICDISGIRDVHGPNYRLSHIELHGNRLQSISHIIQSLEPCINLRHISLAQGGADNPLCSNSGYRQTILSALTQVKVLDGRDRSGRQAEMDNVLADIPGLEQYMEYLVSNGSSSDTTNTLDVVTPNIDAALELFRHRAATTPEISSSATITTDHETSHSQSPHRMSSQFKTHQFNHDSRLEKLENQLAALLNTQVPHSDHKSSKFSGQTTASNRSSEIFLKHKAKRDIDDTDESDSNENPSTGKKGASSSNNRGKKSRLPHFQKTTTAYREKISKHQLETSKKSVMDTNSGAKGQLKFKHCDQVTTSHKVTPVAKDEKLRDDMKDTYVHLMKELEGERERRWKAEQATKKLVDHVRELQSKGKEEHDIQEVTLLATGRLKDALKAERENKMKMQAEIELLQEQLQKVNLKLEESEKREDEVRVAMRTLQETSNHREQEYIRQNAHEGKKLQEACIRASASHRELDIVKNQTKSLQGQVQQLQELLATREQEHRKELAGRYTLESKELQDLITREISRTEKLHSQELKLQQQTIDNLSKQYGELENEFRQALHIESKRFTELQDAYEKVSNDGAYAKQELLSLQQRGDTSSSMVSELTALVKEQKGRLTELAKAKQEQSIEYRERVSTLEQHLEEARKRMLQLEMLKQEKVKMSSQLQAQESVIEGLKAERKLWGEELAQQGVSLSQDRGRMEAKIEALISEVATLKKHLEREADAVRIKTKMIEDQTESIRKLKQGLFERDEEIKKTREDMLKVQKDSEEQLLAELTANQEFQEKLDRSRERKEELKQQLVEADDKLEQTEKAYSELNNKWKQKTSVISELEQQVSQMRTVWQNKEKKLTEDRDKAMEAAKIAVDKIHTMDDAFRQQLDNKEQRHSEIVQKLHSEKQNEIDRANKKVLQVEEEMRELLKETESSKRATEEKVKKLTRTLGELQQDLF